MGAPTKCQYTAPSTSRRRHHVSSYYQRCQVGLGQDPPPPPPGSEPLPWHIS